MRFITLRYLGAIVYVVLLATTGLVHAQSSATSNVEANQLFVEAVMLYRQATALPAAQAADPLDRVRRLFDRILVNHPDSLPGQAIRSGGSPGGVDLTALPPTPPAGWNDGKRGIARDLLNAYGGKLEELELVADSAEYAVLAWAAYGDKEVIDLLGESGWHEHSFSREGHFVVPSTLGGGDAVARLFVSDQGDAALAFRGTTTKKDWLTNAGTVLPIYSDQLRSARVLADRARALYPDVTFVGHSLGGAMAQVARLHTGQVAVIFNSAPMGLHELGMAISGEPLDRQVNSALLAFRSPEDPLREVSEGISGFKDLVVRNIALTNNTVFRNVLDGVAGTGFAHAMPVLATAIVDVRLARDQRWLYAYLLEQSGIAALAEANADTKPNESDGGAAIKDCERQFITVSVGESKCGYSLGSDGIVKFHEKNVFRFDQVSADIGYHYNNGERVPAGTNTRIKLFPQSPSGRFHIINACHYECGDLRLFDSHLRTTHKVHAGHYGPDNWIEWSEAENYALLYSYNEEVYWLHIVDTVNSASYSYPEGRGHLSSIALEEVEWVGPERFTAAINGERKSLFLIRDSRIIKTAIADPSGGGNDSSVASEDFGPVRKFEMDGPRIGQTRPLARQWVHGGEEPLRPPESVSGRPPERASQALRTAEIGDQPRPPPELTRETALRALRHHLSGEVAVRRDSLWEAISVADFNLEHLKFLLEGVIFSPISSIPIELIARIHELSEFQKRPSEKSLEALSFLQDLGHSRFATKLVSTRGYPGEPEKVLDLQFGAVDLNLWVFSIEVERVLGVFENGPIAEVQFQFGQPDPNVIVSNFWSDQELTYYWVMDKAESLGVPFGLRLRLVESGKPVERWRNPPDLGTVQTAFFRKYDDGWRLWEVK